SYSRLLPDLLQHFNASIMDSRTAHYRGAGMKGAETLLHQRRRSMAYRNTVHGKPEAIGGNLAKYRLKSLPDRGRADIHGYRAIAFQTHSHAFAGAGSATFHEAAQAEAVIAAVDQLSLEMLFFCPTEFFEAALEYLAI